MTPKILFIVFFLVYISTQGHAQDVYKPRIDSLKSTTMPKTVDSLYLQPKDDPTYFNSIMRQKLESNFNVNSNFDYLRGYKFKSYNMSEFYKYHRHTTTPGFIRDQNPLPPYVNFQKVEIIKKKNK